MKADIKSLSILVLTTRGSSYPPIFFTVMRPPMSEVWGALMMGCNVQRNDVAAIKFIWEDSNGEELAIVVDAERLMPLSDSEFPQELNAALNNWCPHSKS